MGRLAKNELALMVKREPFSNNKSLIQRHFITHGSFCVRR